MAADIKQFDRKKSGEIARPRFRTVQDTEKGRNVGKFFDFWRKIPPEHTELVEVRIYRRYPICDIKKVHPGRNRVDWEMFEGPINRATLTYSVVRDTGETVDFDVEDYEQLFNERYGSGQWRLLLNEKGVSNNLMEAIFDCGDLNTFPPKLDYHMVIPDHPKNEGYVSWLQNQNIPLPWTTKPKDEGEEDDMAANEALKTVADALVRQSEKNMEMTEKVADARVEAAEALSQQPDQDMVAENASIKLVCDTAQRTNDMMAQMVEKHAGKQYDPVEMLEATGRIYERMRGPGGDSSTGGLTDIVKLTIESQKESFAAQMAARDREVDLLKSLVLGKGGDGSPITALATRAAEPEQPKSFAEQLKELRTMSELMGWTNGGRSKRDDDDGSEKPVEKSIWLVLAENAAPIMTGLTTLGFLTANVIYNSRLKPEEKAVSPQEALQKMQPTAAPASQQQPQSGSTQAAPGPLGEWGMFLQQIEQPFLQHFYDTPKSNGYTLAYFIQTDGGGAAITPTGRQTYMVLKERLGVKGLDLLIKNYQPIWSKVQGTPQQYEKFLKELFTYDEWQAAQDQEPEAA